MAELLAEAGFYGGMEAQAFPNFGVERRGAPVTAYVRLDKKPIRLRSQVYSPDYVIIQDVSLLADDQILADLKKGATIIINTKQATEGLKIPKGVKIKTINASGIALEVIGRPIINTIMLGAFAGATGLIKLDAVEKAIRKRFSGEIGDKNVEAAKRGLEVISNN
jgi:pyruvate ferredoxin oxidoreductase gamma subunit